MNDTAPITLSFVPSGPDFAMSADATMPVITVTAKLRQPPSAGAILRFVWTIKLRSASLGCAHGLGRVTSHPDIVETTAVEHLTIAFSRMRGGNLSIAVAVTVDGHALTAERHDLSVSGTNPAVADLRAALPDAPEAFKKLMRLESGLRQFRTPPCSLWSADNLGGVGICQLTPPDDDDQIWNWKANVAGGLALYHGKERIARSYAAIVRGGPTFRGQSKAYNDKRAAAARPAGASAGPRPPVTIRVPDYTAAQLELDTIRAFNGYAGGLHEYRLRTDADGILVVTLDAAGAGGMAEWARVTAAERTAHYDAAGISAGHRGDPNYVDDVVGQASF
ncbi:MAG: hypothetical protein ACRYG4_21345 [Janthinobacterium lividum]